MAGVTPVISPRICPQCGSPVGGGDIVCTNCGVDLVLMAMLAEQQVLASLPLVKELFVPDVVLPRFGQFLLANQYITEKQLETALARQRELASAGQQKTIGQILLDVGAVTREQIDQASLQQLRQSQQALIESNRRLQEHVAERTAELQEAIHKLDELSQLKANFISTISHELRTPLTHIQGYCDLLKEGAYGPLSEEQNEALETLNTSARHLYTLINDLIRFASSARGEMKLTLSPFLPKELTSRVMEAMLPKAAAAGVSLILDAPFDLPPAQGDGEKIYWVLFQLVDNAIKFTPAPGQVMLRAEAREGHLRLSVQDTGIGFPVSRLKEIFQPFHQLDGSSSRFYGGMGLGLALVKRVLDIHQAPLEVESELERGSAFAFELPLAH